MKLLIVDLETTGLDPAQHITLEIAAQVVDLRDPEHVIDSFEALIRPASWSCLDAMAPVVWEMHTEGAGGGLLGAVRRDGRDERAVAAAFFEFMAKHVTPTGANPHRPEYPRITMSDKLTIAGNSPHAVDTPFLRALFARQPQMGRNLDTLCHYRQIDMTAVATALDVLGFPLPPIMLARAENAHRAMVDADHCRQQIVALSKAYRPVLDVLAAPSPRSLNGIQDALGVLNDAVGMPARDRARLNLSDADQTRRRHKLETAADVKADAEDSSPAGDE